MPTELIIAFIGVIVLCGAVLYYIITHPNVVRIKITPDILLQKGFIERPSLIQHSYELILINTDEEDPFIPGARSITYKSISLTECNDKGKGEYYVFIREGSTGQRHEDEVITITRNMLYVDDLIKLIHIIKL